MKSDHHQDPEAFAHSTSYLVIRKFVCEHARFLIRPWTFIKRIIWLIRYPTAKLKFEQIHRSNTWACGESLSGDGSTLESTEGVRKALEKFIREHAVKSMLDVPCGDFNWMQHVQMDGPYIGGDIVEQIILNNQSKFGDDLREFKVIDLTKSSLPKCDLVFSRDCLNHLSMTDIRKAINNMVASGADFFAVSQFPAVTVNRNQESGFTYRGLNFCLPPFNWPDPIADFDEQFHPGKHIGFWSIADLPNPS